MYEALIPTVGGGNIKKFKDGRTQVSFSMLPSFASPVFGLLSSGEKLALIVSAD